MRNVNSAVGFSTSATGTDFSNQTGDTSQAALYSQPIRLDNMEVISFQPVWTGTTTGTFKLQISNDDSVNVPTPYTPTNWTDVPSGPTASPAGSAGNGIVGFNAVGTWMRMVYTKASGTGTVTCRVCARGPE